MRKISDKIGFIALILTSITLIVLSIIAKPVGVCGIIIGSIWFSCGITVLILDKVQKDKV